MNAETLNDLLHRVPFQPFEVRMSSGETYEVRHPEFAFVLKSKLVIGFPGTDRAVTCSLLHITSVMDIESAQPAS